MAGPYAVHVQGLNKNYGSLKAVSQFDLDIAKGECFALLGPNGAGKTTVCEILEGLTQPDSGDVSIFGLSYSRNRQEILQQIGVQLQETHMYKKYTVKETLELFASFYDGKTRDISTTISDLHLEDKTNIRLEKLSGGQKQRVYLGCALIHYPKLVFLDEPTAALDPQSRHFIWKIIETIKASGCSVFLTTHNMDEAQTLADRVGIMDQGKIIAEGSPQALIECHIPQTKVTFAFNKEIPEDQLIKAWRWTHDLKKNAQGFFEVFVVNPTQVLIDLSKLSERENVTLSTLSLNSSTLEDVFLKLTGKTIRG